jgi:hypothetical protein
VTISVLFTFITNLCCLFEFERTKRRTTVAIAVVVKVPTEWLGLWFLHRVSEGRYWSEVKLRWREGERRWCCLLRYIWRLERKPIVIRLLLRASKRGLEAKNVVLLRLIIVRPFEFVLQFANLFGHCRFAFNHNSDVQIRVLDQVLVIF